MAAGSDGSGSGTTRKTFLVAGGCVLAAALVGAGWRRSRRPAGAASARPRRADNLSERATAEGVELRPLPLDPHGPVFALNRSAAVVWSAVDGRRSVTGIGGELAAAFGLSAEVAQRDARACLRSLAAQGIVTGVPGTTAAEAARS